MWKLKEEYGDKIEFRYKTFPLAPNPEMILWYFGSAEQGKQEILTHWTQTKTHSGGEKINPELMAGRNFDYPYSMPGLVACKCAEEQLGPQAHERMKDLLQRTHLVECRNIGDRDVIYGASDKLNLDLEEFAECYDRSETNSLVMKDHKEAINLGIRGTPTVVFENKIIVRGAVPLESYRQVINRLINGSQT